MTQVHANAKFIGMSAQKVRLVVDLVRGKPADDALTMLKFLPNAAAEPVAKVLRTAIANAEENFGLSRDDLVVATALPMRAPRASGSALAPAAVQADFAALVAYHDCGF